ncbi:hypothetical protein AYO21_11389 [Fonsecaea monophora]|uniref:DUF7924 domain-containing protein n=1 Tax=Fonsecaea monophora TaxID=254056 RepID=A0A177ER47_9EURO|nr:hypothetical protein AYO21_11389 [Fonsecaea monophora]OAG34437.1 hypothetical protein AYO21_11389 [Fonsecaea monophora]
MDSLQSSPSMFSGAGKRRRCEAEDSNTLAEPSAKRQHLDSVDASQPTVEEQLPSPEVTNSSEGRQHHSGEIHRTPLLPQEPPSDLRGVADPISEESHTFLESQSQNPQIREWVLGTEGSGEDDPQPPPIEPYPDPYPEALIGMPSVKRKPSQESLGPVSLYADDLESIASTDAKSNFYSSPAFPTLLEQHGTYMKDSASGLDAEELEFCQGLLSTSVPHPPNSMLDDAVFMAFSELTHNKSEQWLVKNMHSHLFPAPELLAIRGHKEFEDLGLIEACSDMWLRSIFPSYGKCPQPDSTIGFKWEKFSRKEVLKLGITIGAPSKYMARDDIFFPFITREAKCDKQPLDIADRQNVYSMSVALDGVIDLFRRAGQLEELNGKALGLSMSYDNNTVRIYAHHVVTKPQESQCQTLQQLPNLSTVKYRTIIGEVSLSKDGGKDRWQPYDFFYNACLKFSGRHLQRIKMAIERLPDPTAPPAPPASVPSASSMDESGQTSQTGQDPQGGEGVFKKPRNGGINGELRKQLASLESQLGGLQRQLEEQKQRELGVQGQLARQQEDSKVRESALQDLLARQQDDSRRRESDLKEQLDRMFRLLENRSQ